MFHVSVRLRKTTLGGLILAVLFMLFFLAILPARAAGARLKHGVSAGEPPGEVCVDDDFAGASAGDVLDGLPCGMGEVIFGTDAFATITDGVNGVADGGVVHIANGTYQEQVHISAKQVSLVGQSLYAEVQAPDTVPVCAHPPGPDYDWHAIVCATDGAHVTVDTLTVNGLSKGNDNARFMGVAFYNSDGVLRNSTVLNIKDSPFDGVQHGLGFYMYTDDDGVYTVTVEDNTFLEFQKNGITVVTDGTSTVTATIAGNIVWGHGATDRIAQNGIEVWQHSATSLLQAEIGNNAVHEVAYDNTNDSVKWVATSILPMFATVDIHDNVIDGAHSGIYDWLASGAITDNEVSIEKVGVYAFGIIVDDPPKAVPSPVGEGGSVPEAPEARALSSSAPYEISLTGNKITGDANTETYGLYVTVGYGDSDTSLVASRNTITGFDKGVYFYQCNPDAESCGTGVLTQAKMRENTITDNTYGAYGELLDYMVDATRNWWGSGSGPYNETSNVNGLGNEVYGTVEFQPWCTDAYCTPYIPALGDFNGDGKADIAVFRGSDDRWYIRGIGQFTYGAGDDIPVPADYNGDGKADIAVFRGSDNTWYIRGMGHFAYGTEGDVPVPGDYNGDGKADIAVFRPSANTWYIRGIGHFAYGTTGDIPVPADYDGDGKADIAVFRPSNSGWYIRGIGHVTYGADGDIPIPGDYNGDGKAEVAVFRPSNGTWYIRGIGSFVYGVGGDIPVPGDYNGDGKAEVAVFRPSNGTWYIRGIGAFVYGTGGDIPAEPTFVPGLTP